MTARPRVGVVVLAYGDEPWLGETVAAVLGSTGVDLDLVVVDNGARPDAVAQLPADPRLTLVRPPANLGFTGGVHAGAARLDTPLIACVNSDAIVEAGALAALAAAVDDPAVAMASGSIRLASDPSTMNTAGNPLHVLGLSWAGGLGEPATDHERPGPVPSASGAVLMIRRDAWEDLGGFCREFFAYLEDAELSWRCWMTGRQVRYEPAAVAVHHYEFSRNPRKAYLLERNRLLFVLTCWGPRMLALLAPVLAAFELAVLAVALRQGWAGAKIRGWAWTLRHLGWIAARRRHVQGARRVPDSVLVPLLTSHFDPAALALPPGAGVLQRLMDGYWKAVRRWV